MEIPDPLEQIERKLKQIEQLAYRQFRPVHRRYPILFLLLITFSVAAVFHGFDGMMDKLGLFNESPIILVLIGILGLLITGTLYQRLGKDKYDE